MRSLVLEQRTRVANGHLYPLGHFLGFETRLSLGTDDIEVAARHLGRQVQTRELPGFARWPVTNLRRGPDSRSLRACLTRR